MGRRGVVRPGDVIQLGASTRLLLVEGLSSEEVQRLVSQQQQLQTTVDKGEKQPESSSTKEEEDVSWGISADESEPHGGDAFVDDILDLKDDMIPDQHRKAWERISALQ
jgi:hypothetical protein